MKVLTLTDQQAHELEQLLIDLIYRNKCAVGDGSCNHRSITDCFKERNSISELVLIDILYELENTERG